MIKNFGGFINELESNVIEYDVDSFKKIYSISLLGDFVYNLIIKKFRKIEFVYIWTQEELEGYPSEIRDTVCKEVTFSYDFVSNTYNKYYGDKVEYSESLSKEELIFEMWGFANNNQSKSTFNGCKVLVYR